MPVPDAETSPVDDDLVVRLPRQQRSREAWARILDAGVAIVEDGGYDAFTIAAVCERADVAPRALYERVNSKDGLFLAVYEHKMNQVTHDQDALFDDSRWTQSSPEELIRGAVRAMVELFAPHTAFLRSVILISGVHPEVYRRGSMYARSLGDLFTAVVMRAAVDIHHTDPETAVRMSFNTAFSTLVLRISYGPGFAAPAVDDDTFITHLTEMIGRYLLRPRIENPA
ncbi:MAG: TetR/AcrR family transcriptional regulator [Rhodococcus sp. (in: high G+C Gram-positive bacteria)]|nr:MAG: TetR/AcrR family transcriptional regulator [Rhodococcus sp. (in: high G+C Gram-positive bacteria)]